MADPEKLDPLAHIVCDDCGWTGDLLEIATDKMDAPGHCWTCGHPWPEHLK